MKEINNLTIEEKQKMIFKILEITEILPKGAKDKVEGIIIGLNIRENLGMSNSNQSNCIIYNINKKEVGISGWTNKKGQSSYDTEYI